ncbi:MAG: hypothetical protein RI955_407 [Bacteroidota bacterium]
MITIKNLLKSQFIKNVTKIISGTLVGQLVVFLLSPVLTHLYTAEFLGVLAVFISASTTPWALANFRLDLAIPLEEETTEARYTAYTAIIISIVVLFLSEFLMLLVGKNFFLLLNIEELYKYKFLIPIAIFFIALYYTLQSCHIQKKEFTHNAVAKAIQNIAMIVIQVVLGYYFHTTVFLIVGYILGYLLASGYQLYYLRLNIAELNYVIKNKLYTIKFRKHQSFAKYSTIATVINTASITLPSIFIAMYYNAEMVGFFALSQNLIGLPTNMLTMAISQVFLGESSKWLQKKPDQLRQFILKSFKTICLLAIIPTVLFYFLTPPIFNVVFGQHWSASAKIVQIMLILYISRLVTTPYSHTLNVFGYQWLQFVWDILRLTSVCVVFIVMGIQKFDFYSTIFGYSLIMGIFYFIHIVLCLRVLKIPKIKS